MRCAGSRCWAAADVDVSVDAAAAADADAADVDATAADAADDVWPERITWLDARAAACAVVFLIVLPALLTAPQIDLPGAPDATFDDDVVLAAAAAADVVGVRAALGGEAVREVWPLAAAVLAILRALTEHTQKKRRNIRLLRHQ